jgi:archaellum component FlaF (FlaF/FlaG flagellin family)
MGASTAMVVALFFLCFLIVAAAVYSSANYSQNLINNARQDQDTMKKAKMKTDIAIINVTNKTTSLNITLQNMGETALNASLFEIFVNGVYYSNYTLSSGNTWPPMNYSNITIPVAASSGSRVKVVTENGISAYALSP